MGTSASEKTTNLITLSDEALLAEWEKVCRDITTGPEFHRGWCHAPHAGRSQVWVGSGDFHVMRPRTLATEFPFSDRRIPQLDFSFVQSPSQMGNDELTQLHLVTRWHEIPGIVHVCLD